MKKKSSILNSLYLRISLTFLVLLAVIGFAYIIITVYYSRIYFQHVNQTLNHDVAANIVSNYPSLQKVKFSQNALDSIFKHAMSINPNLEFYVLDTEGVILLYYPRDKVLKLRQVNLTLINEFLQKRENKYMTGDDPRNPHTQKVFSAAAIKDNASVAGYLYVVLTSADYDAASESLLGNFFLELGFGGMIWTLVAAFVIGLISFRLLTRSFREVIEVMQKFKDGDLTARVKVRSTGDVKMLADFFNEMADVLTGNIEKLKTIEVLRRELIGNISHDLRTPLSIIHGYIETLQIKEKSLTAEDKKRYMNIILESTIGLKKMVSELFELSKLEANQVKAKMEPVAISELVSDISHKYHLLAEAKKISIKPFLSKDLPPILADISLVERVVQNLLDNAIKFTPSGGEITVTTRLINEKIEVAISDTGTGISRSDQERILSPVNKPDDTSGLKSGNGLGLAIVKKILELHGSVLEFNNNIPTGSAFSFRLKPYQQLGGSEV
ncbi:MAG TPA: HAMP domain-containing sensor histidine kinase [Flavitalea sp.]|nr:HAMP domain-containing sensor histidine kinase [Flavitalea sp.]